MNDRYRVFQITAGDEIELRTEATKWLMRNAFDPIFVNRLVFDRGDNTCILEFKDGSVEKLSLNEMPNFVPPLTPWDIAPCGHGFDDVGLTGCIACASSQPKWNEERK